MQRLIRLPRIILCSIAFVLFIVCGGAGQAPVQAGIAWNSKMASIRLVPAQDENAATVAPPLTGLNARITSAVTRQSLLATLIRIIDFCAKQRENELSNPRQPISRANVQVLSRLLSSRKPISLTPDIIQKMDYRELNKLLKGVLKFRSEAQKNCFEGFISLGAQFENPPNACRVRDNEFPVSIQHPMWWFAMTFNRSESIASKSEVYQNSDQSARPNNPERQVIEYFPTSDGNKSDGGEMRSDMVRPTFPLGCAVGYDKDRHAQLREVQCKFVSQNSRLISADWPKITYQPLKSAEGVPYENGIVEFDGTWHIECPIDMTLIVYHSGGRQLYPDWNDYSTFWLKASGIPKRTGAEQPFVFFRPHKTSVSQASSRSPSTHLADDGNIGLQVSLDFPGNAPNIVTAQLLNSPFTTKFPVKASDDRIQTWGSHVQRMPGPPSRSQFTAWYINDIDASSRTTSTIRSYSAAPFDVPFFPVGTFYIGYDPGTNITFTGLLDEAIVDPSDGHPP